MTSVIEQWAVTIRKAATFNPNTQVAPAAVLWTDKERQWQPVLAQLQAALPELLVLGPLDVERRTGPAIWLKCVIAKTLSAVALPDELTPVIYLPGISRSELRDVVNCPDDIKPLAELQYRGVMCSQYNGKDWTVNAFLTSGSSGLSLDVAGDNSTQQAMLMAVGELLISDVASLTGRRLEASDFNQLLSSDPIKDLLTWLNAPDQAREAFGEARWRALCNEATREYGLDVEGDGELAGAEKLCAADGQWLKVWQRYEDMPGAFPALFGLLSRVMPPDLFADTSRYPHVNDQQEVALHGALTALLGGASDEVRSGIEALESQHGQRRSALWAKIGQSPWSLLLEPLTEVARLTKQPIGGLSPEEQGERYSAQGWQTDAAALRCLELCQSTEQTRLIVGLLADIYRPWLEDVNERFQRQVVEKGYPGLLSHEAGGKVNEATAEYRVGGECVFFVDGLRLDVAHRLIQLLADKGIQGTMTTQWSALPSVTATAKPAVSPIAPYLHGLDTDTDFGPSVKGKGVLTHDRFKRLLSNAGWQYLEQDDLGDVTGNAWTACGDIDKDGHSSELKLPQRIPPILAAIVDRILELQQVGWRKIRIVTDHGWLLVPGNMAKIDLPAQAAESRWGRCAQVKSNVKVDGLTLGWHWNANIAIHYPPGIHSFIAGRAYSHGGVSLQECLIPVISIEGQNKPVIQASIETARWLGLTCKVTVSSQSEGLRVDLRTKLADGTTSLVQAKPVIDGQVKLMVLDDDNEGLQAMIVVLDGDGTVLAKLSTTVGGEE